MAGALLTSGIGQAQEEAAASMDELLNLIQQGQARDSEEARQREQRSSHRHAQGEQQNMLNQARAERTRQENTSARLEGLFNENQQAHY